MYRNDREATVGSSKHGGALIAIKHSVRHQRLQLPLNIPDVVMIKVELGSYNCLLCCIYSAPGDSVYTLTCSQLIELLAHMNFTAPRIGCTDIFVIGDINFSSTTWGTMYSSDQKEMSVLEYLFEHNFTQLILGKTRQLDVFLTNNPDPVLSVSVENQVKSAHSSDHNPFLISLESGSSVSSAVKTLNKKRDFPAFSLKQGDWQGLEKYLATNPFAPYCFSNVNLMVDLWYDWLYQAFEKIVPKKTKHRIGLPPWVSSQSSHLMKIKQRLRRCSQENPKMIAKVRDISNQLDKSLDCDQLQFEKSVFEHGAFSEIQKVP